MNNTPDNLNSRLFVFRPRPPLRRSWIGKLFPYVGFIERELETVQQERDVLLDRFSRAMSGLGFSEPLPSESDVGAGTAPPAGPFSTVAPEPIRSAAAMSPDEMMRAYEEATFEEAQRQFPRGWSPEAAEADRIEAREAEKEIVEVAAVRERRASVGMALNEAERMARPNGRSG